MRKTGTNRYGHFPRGELQPYALFENEVGQSPHHTHRRTLRPTKFSLSMIVNKLVTVRCTEARFRVKGVNSFICKNT